MDDLLTFACIAGVIFMLYMNVIVTNDNNDILIELRDSSCISEEKRND